MTAFHLNLGGTCLPSASLPASPEKRKNRRAGEKAIMQQNEELYLNVDFLTIKDRRVVREQLPVCRVVPQHGSSKGSRPRFNQDSQHLELGNFFRQLFCALYLAAFLAYPSYDKQKCLQKLPNVY